MSVLTEASDLEAVLKSAKTWDFVDPGRIVLLGGSMGGLVTTVAGSRHQYEIAGKTEGTNFSISLSKMKTYQSSTAAR